MKVAIMQPYFLPYIGYFQLINEVDTFVFYNDVQFRKNSWFHRNRIPSNSTKKEFIYIGLQLKKYKSKNNINEIELDDNHIWKQKLLRKIQFSYPNTGDFIKIFEFLKKILYVERQSLASFNINTLIYITKLLNITDKVFVNSEDLDNSKLRGVDRVIDTCKLLNADSYINLIGGKDLYTKSFFLEKNINLEFLETRKSSNFNVYFSILDLLLKNKVSSAINHLNEVDHS